MVPARAHSLRGKHGRTTRAFRATIASWNHRWGPRLMDRSHASRCRRVRWLVARGRRRVLQRSGALAHVGREHGLRPGAQLRHRRRPCSRRKVARRRHRCGGDHDAQRHALRVRAAALDAGLDVVCDKPVTETFTERPATCSRARAGSGRVFAIAHGYSAYPMTRYARTLVRDGTLGADPAGAGRVHPGRHGDARRGWPEEQSPRTGCSIPSAADSRWSWARSAATRSNWRASRRQEHRARRADVRRSCPVARSSTTCRRCWNSKAARAARSQSRRPPPVARTTSGCASTARTACSTGRIARPGYLRLALQGEPARVIGRGDTFLPADIVAAGTHTARPSGRFARGLRQHLRRSGAGADGARTRRTRSPTCPIRASRTARTRWRSSRRAWHRRRRARGCPSRRRRRPDAIPGSRAYRRGSG